MNRIPYSYPRSAYSTCRPLTQLQAVRLLLGHHPLFVVKCGGVVFRVVVCGVVLVVSCVVLVECFVSVTCFCLAPPHVHTPNPITGCATAAGTLG